MPRGQTGRSYLWFGMLVAAALIVWLLLSRAGRPPSAPAAAANHAPVAAAGPQAARAPQAPAPPGAPATRAGTAEAGSTPAPETPPPALSPGAAGADERQLVKIARGLTLGPDGTLRVSATPPGSVVGQLHLQPGDVIVTVNGRAVSTPEDFARLYHEQGPPTELTLLRDGQEIHRH
jgi:membrane-associated protease RseP (regulator of RpoE activity)